MSLEEHWNRLAVHFKRRRRTALPHTIPTE